MIIIQIETFNTGDKWPWLESFHNDTCAFRVIMFTKNPIIFSTLFRHVSIHSLLWSCCTKYMSFWFRRNRLHCYTGPKLVPLSSFPSTLGVVVAICCYTQLGRYVDHWGLGGNHSNVLTACWLFDFCSCSLAAPSPFFSYSKWQRSWFWDHFA